MRIFILLYSILEIVAGIVFFFFPLLLEGMDSMNINAIAFARLYGVAAMSVSFIGISAYQKQNDLLTKEVLRFFTVFNIGLVLACYSGYQMGLRQLLGGVFFHAVIAVSCVYFLKSKNL